MASRSLTRARTRQARLRERRRTSESVSVKPPAKNMTPKMSNGAEDPPVKGKSRPLTDFTTEVDVTADPLVVVDPNGATLVAVSPVVVEFAGRVVVLAAGAVVGDDGNVVE